MTEKRESEQHFPRQGIRRLEIGPETPCILSSGARKTTALFIEFGYPFQPAISARPTRMADSDDSGRMLVRGQRGVIPKKNGCAHRHSEVSPLLNAEHMNENPNKSKHVCTFGL